MLAQVFFTNRATSQHFFLVCVMCEREGVGGRKEKWGREKGREREGKRGREGTGEREQERKREKQVDTQKEDKNIIV